MDTTSYPYDAVLKQKFGDISANDFFKFAQRFAREICQKHPKVKQFKLFVDWQAPVEDALREPTDDKVFRSEQPGSLIVIFGAMALDGGGSHFTDAFKQAKKSVVFQAIADDNGNDRVIAYMELRRRRPNALYFNLVDAGIWEIKKMFDNLGWNYYVRFGAEAYLDEYAIGAWY